jgi:hypothetical protein
MKIFLTVLAAYFIAIGAVKLVIALVVKRREDNAERKS